MFYLGYLRVHFVCINCLVALVSTPNTLCDCMFRLVKKMTVILNEVEECELKRRDCTCLIRQFIGVDRSKNVRIVKFPRTKTLETFDWFPKPASFKSMHPCIPQQHRAKNKWLRCNHLNHFYLENNSINCNGQIFSYFSNFERNTKLTKLKSVEMMMFSKLLVKKTLIIIIKCKLCLCLGIVFA